MYELKKNMTIINFLILGLKHPTSPEVINKSWRPYAAIKDCPHI